MLASRIPGHLAARVSFVRNHLSNLMKNSSMFMVPNLPEKIGGSPIAVAIVRLFVRSFVMWIEGDDWSEVRSKYYYYVISFRIKIGNPCRARQICGARS